eukprot:evm.model.NODE_15034_length_10610_cov_53.885864.3
MVGAAGDEEEEAEDEEEEVAVILMSLARGTEEGGGRVLDMAMVAPEAALEKVERKRGGWTWNLMTGE